MSSKGFDYNGPCSLPYPGAMCDIESYVYMPMLEELDYVPTERYAHAPELLQHSCNIADRCAIGVLSSNAICAKSDSGFSLLSV